MGARTLLVGLVIGVAIVVALVAVTRCLPEAGNGIEWVQRPEAVVVQMKSVGGLPQTDVMDRATVPDFTLYGDGTLIFIRPSERGQLNHATLHQTTLPPDAVRDLLKSITDTGFLNFSYAQPKLGAYYDFPTTYLYANTKAAANAVSAYALEGAPPAGAEWDQFRKLQEIKSRLDTIANDAIAAGATTESVPNAVVLVVSRPTIVGRAQGNWPFPEIDPDSFAPETGVGEKRIEGTAAHDILAAAPQLAGPYLTQNGHAFLVAYRPVLPYEENFPEFEPPTP